MHGGVRKEGIMYKLSQTEISVFLRLFNRDGYVLDFSTENFDNFTMQIVGEALCEKYKLSKGKSLGRYLNEASDENKIKLIIALFEHYKAFYTREIECDDDDQCRLYYKKIYLSCEDIIKRIKSDNYVLDSYIKKIGVDFSNEYFDQQVKYMLEMQGLCPTDAIGKAKELIETCCKTILEKSGITYGKTWDIGQLANETLNTLSLLPKNISNTVKAYDEIKAILGNLRAIATNIAELRNSYGSGHGKSSNYKGLEERHAKLAVGSSITFVTFIWDTYLSKQN